jgi:hypothetical protein
MELGHLLTRSCLTFPFLYDNKIWSIKITEANGPISVLMRVITEDFEVLKPTPLFVDSFIQHTVLYSRQF